MNIFNKFDSIIIKFDNTIYVNGNYAIYKVKKDCIENTPIKQGVIPASLSVSLKLPDGEYYCKAISTGVIQTDEKQFTVIYNSVPMIINEIKSALCNTCLDCREDINKDLKENFYNINVYMGKSNIICMLDAYKNFTLKNQYNKLSSEKEKKKFYDKFCFNYTKNITLDFAYIYMELYYIMSNTLRESEDDLNTLKRLFDLDTFKECFLKYNIDLDEILEDIKNYYDECDCKNDDTNPPTPVEKHTLSIQPTPSDSVVIINGVQTNSVTVDKGSIVNWHVSKTGYISKQGSVTVNTDQTINVVLEEVINNYTLNINVIYPTDAIVKINDQVRNSITVPFGSNVSYTVERNAFITKSADIIVTENKTIDVLLEPDLLATDIMFKIQSNTQNENLSIILLRTEDSEAVARIDYGDGTIENITIPPFSGSESWTDNEGNIHYIDNGNTFKHTYAEPGIYQVRVIAGNNVYYARLCDSLIQGTAGYMIPSVNPNIIEISKFKSSSISNLDYTLAGLVNANVTSDFLLDTPNVTSMNATFYQFGQSVEFSAFPELMLTQVPLVTHLRGTFFASGLKRILPGFFMNLPELISVFECFKNSKLGKGHYEGRKAGTYITESIDGSNDFIPSSLFWYNPKLKDISHCFSYIGEGWYGNLNSGYLAFYIIRRELFFNGMMKGNTTGTIENAFYAFGKTNRILCEPNLFKYAPNLKHLGGIFTQTNHINHAVSWAGVIPIAATESTIYTYDDNGAISGQVDGKGLTFDLNVIFPLDSYPNVLTLNGAFTTAAIGTTMGFQHNINYNENGVNIVINQSINGKTFLDKFPNAKADSVDEYAKNMLGQSGGTDIQKKDGRNGVFYMLDQDDRISDKQTIDSLVFNNAIPY
jgi:hypothetical protein